MMYYCTYLSKHPARSLPIWLAYGPVITLHKDRLRWKNPGPDLGALIAEQTLKFRTLDWPSLRVSGTKDPSILLAQIPQVAFFTHKYIILSIYLSICSALF